MDLIIHLALMTVPGFVAGYGIALLVSTARTARKIRNAELESWRAATQFHSLQQRQPRI